MIRDLDILTGEDSLSVLHEFKQFPVFNGTTNKPVSEDIFRDMSWKISETTGMIQLSSLLEPEIVYEHQTTTAAVGLTWQQHHELFAEFVLDHTDHKDILEIGGAHGILSKICQDKNTELNWCIIEPKPAPVDGCNAIFIEEFFSSELLLPVKYKTVVHSHVLEHIYTPRNFLSDIHSYMDIGDQMIFSIPNLKEWLDRKFTNALNFEHTYFAREEYVDWLLAVNGFDILNKKYVMDGHSIFYFTRRSVKKEVICPNLVANNKLLWSDFVLYFEDQAQKINKIMPMFTNNFIFGANIFAQHLLNVGVNSGFVSGILDNDANKHNQRLYGFNLTVFSPQKLKGMKDVAVYLYAGKYNDEISKGILEINPEVKIIS